MSYYKHKTQLKNPRSKYEKFYRNTEINQIEQNFDVMYFEENFHKTKDCDRSKYRNPYDDINQLFESFTNQTGNPIEIIVSLTKTVESKITEVGSAIIETNFIPFLVHAIVKIPFESFEPRAYLSRLIWLILQNYKSLQIIFFKEGLLPAFSNIFYNDNNVHVLMYSIFSIIQLFKSFGHNHMKDFEQYISITNLLNKYIQVKELMTEQFIQQNKVYETLNIKQQKSLKKDQKRMKLIVTQILKGTIVLTSEICYYRLSNEESISAFKLSYITLTEDLPKNYANIRAYGLKALSFLIESHNINYEIFDNLNLFHIVKSKLGSGVSLNRIYSCKTLVALFENCYFQNGAHIFDYDINNILQHIDDFEDKSDFLRLLAAIIRNDVSGGEYIRQFFASPNKNEKGIRTICYYILEGDFGTMEASSHCLIDLFHKMTSELIIEILEEEGIYSSLVEIIKYGLDDENNELVLYALRIVYDLIEFSKKISKFEIVFKLLGQSLNQLANGFDFFMELDQNDDTQISNASELIEQSLQLSDD